MTCRTIINVSDLTKSSEFCPDCYRQISAHDDGPDGIWIECACSAGYTHSQTISVLNF